jgi:short subunit fatty acids transporter
MKFAKPLGLMVVVLGMLVPAQVALASPGKEKTEKVKAEKSANYDKDKNKDKKDKNPVHSVPEPTTLALMGAAVGVAGARKLWQNRRRS